MLRLKYFPEEWKKAVVILVHKKGKPTDKPESYRPIALLPVLRKLFERLISKKIEATIGSSNGLDSPFLVHFLTN